MEEVSVGGTWPIHRELQLSKLPKVADRYRGSSLNPRGSGKGAIPM